MDNKIKISKEKREEMLSAIKYYFYNERSEDLGDLSAMMILDFIIEEIAPEFYNQGIADGHTYMRDKLEDLFALQIYRK